MTNTKQIEQKCHVYVSPTILHGNMVLLIHLNYDTANATSWVDPWITIM